MLYNRKSSEPTLRTQTSDSYFSSSDDYLKSLLVDFPTENTALHFSSNGRYALQDLIVWIARKMGYGASLLVASFNISTDAAQTLLRAYERGILGEIEFVLNGAKKTNSKHGIAMIQGKFPIAFTNNHAKVACISSNEKTAVILSSGNLSAARNREAGVIFFNNTEVYEFHNSWLKQSFSGLPTEPVV